MFNFLRNYQIAFQSGYTILYSNQSWMKVPIPSSNISSSYGDMPANTYYFFFLIVDILVDVKLYLIMVLIYMFLMTNDAEHFSVLIGHYSSYLEKNLFNPLPIFKLGCLFRYWVVSFIYSGNKNLFQYMICNTFSHSIGSSSLSWWWSLKHKSFNFGNIQFINSLFYHLCFWYYMEEIIA